MNILITGGAGFIGSHLTSRLLDDGHNVVVIDNLDDFYDVQIKKSNLINWSKCISFKFYDLNICDLSQLLSIDFKPDVIFHLAAKAGVRPSILNPIDYIRTNIEGSLNVLEFARVKNTKKFIFASSSSVYGVNDNVPWKESDKDLLPISPYAQTKLSVEHLGYTYSTLYNIDFVALRFFTVYGPRQRPDLAIHKFVNLIHNGYELHIYGSGSTLRDYTFIGDIVEGMVSCIETELKGYHIFNLGNNKTVKLLELVREIEIVTGKQAKVVFENEKPGDVSRTFADISKARDLLGYRPAVELIEGIDMFYTWYKEYYGVK